MENKLKGFLTSLVLCNVQVTVSSLCCLLIAAIDIKAGFLTLALCHIYLLTQWFSLNQELTISEIDQDPSIESPIESLPDEILLQVFELMSKKDLLTSTRVCKK